MGVLAGICAVDARKWPPSKLENAARNALGSLAPMGADRAIQHFDCGCLISVSGYTGLDGLYRNERGDIAAIEGRLDEVEDLKSALGVSSALDDAALAWHAYDRWGQDAAAHLKGNFSFALWDDANRRLLIVRDRIGFGPIYFTVLDDALLFSSRINAVLSMAPQLRAGLRHEILEDYAVGEVARDGDRTLFNNVRRLLPANRLVFKNGVCDINSYWSLWPKTLSGDPCEAFRDKLETAITRRLRGAHQVATSLSGGLDSSSITCLLHHRLAERLNLPPIALSSVFDGKNGPDERDYMEAVWRDLPRRSEKLVVDSSNVAAFACLNEMIEAHSQPLWMPNAAIADHPVAELRQRTKADVLLHGHGGDEVVFRAASYLFELAESRQWGELWRQLDMESIGRKNRDKLAYFLWLWIALGPFSRQVWRIRQGVKRRLPGAGAAPWPISADFWSERIRSNYANDPTLFERFRPPRPSPELRALPRSQRDHYRVLTDPLQAYGRETLHHHNSGQGVEICYPFWDVDLVEFCLSLPGSEKWRDGYGRSILRRSMKHILPGAIATRKDKFNFKGYLARSMRNGGGAEIIAHAVYDQAQLLEPYFNTVKLQKTYERFRQGDDLPDGVDLFVIWRAVILGAWLENFREATNNAH